MFAMILGWLGGPIFGQIVEGYKAKLAAGNTSDRIAADLAARELAVQQIEIQTQNQLKIAEIGHFWEPEKLFAYIMVIYFGKIVLWDKVFSYWTNGSTDALHGDASMWAGLIMSFYFGKRTVENAIRIFKR